MPKRYDTVNVISYHQLDSALSYHQVRYLIIRTYHTPETPHRCTMISRKFDCRFSATRIQAWMVHGPWMMGGSRMAWMAGWPCRVYLGVKTGDNHLMNLMNLPSIYLPYEATVWYLPPFSFSPSREYAKRGSRLEAMIIVMTPIIDSLKLFYSVDISLIYLRMRFPLTWKQIRGDTLLYSVIQQLRLQVHMILGTRIYHNISYVIQPQGRSITALSQVPNSPFGIVCEVRTSP